MELPSDVQHSTAEHSTAIDFTRGNYVTQSYIVDGAYLALFQQAKLKCFFKSKSYDRKKY